MYFAVTRAPFDRLSPADNVLDLSAPRAPGSSTGEGSRGGASTAVGTLSTASGMSESGSCRTEADANSALLGSTETESNAGGSVVLAVMLTAALCSDWQVGCRTGTLGAEEESGASH